MSDNKIILAREFVDYINLSSVPIGETRDIGEFLCDACLARWERRASMRSSLWDELLCDRCLAKLRSL